MRRVLIDLVLQLVAVVSVTLLVAMLIVVGPTRLGESVDRIRSNVRTIAPTALTLAIVLLINGVVRDVGVEMSWIIGVNVTGVILSIEGGFVGVLQSLASPPLTAYFSLIYVFGYSFLLTFPLVLYLLHDDARPLHETTVAYIVNYGVGIVCYVLFVAYGPRNVIPELVDPLLYTNWPQSQLLVRQVNANTNVLPSLHTSLSVTVALLAYRFRETYPRWLPIAVWLAASVTTSTMYLGIHWGIDVLAGIALAVLSVSVADRVRTDAVRDRVVAVYGRVAG
ncbi:MAG: membrane-associated phospholipid phosphatase [Halobacteriales archaeon]|jgi:membrane-associated phospholipid phosphatase